MTSFAPSQVIACPHCRYLALRQRMRSINTSGNARWSDGYTSCFPSELSFTRCGRCQGVYWLDDAEVVGTLPEPRREASRKFWPSIFRKLTSSRNDRLPVAQPVPEEWLWAQHVDQPDTDALVIGVENLAGVPIEREQALRRKLWWRFNQQHRYPVASAIGISETIRRTHEQSNLLRLLHLSGGEVKTQSLEEAEIYRELGMFAEAKEALARLNQGISGVAIVAEKIRSKDSRVCILHEEPW